MADSPSDILQKLIIALGYEIQPKTNILIEQETETQLTFEGKFIKASIDPNKALYLSDNDIKLEPLNPKCTKLVKKLFEKFLDTNFPVHTTYHIESQVDPETNQKKYRLTTRIITDKTRDTIGNWYFNQIICYDESIFILEGSFESPENGIHVDLTPYDIIQEEDTNKR